MKTPEQIAEQMIYPRDDKKTTYSLASGAGTLHGLPPGHARHIRAALIAAIEADRAQLRTLSAEAHEAIAQIEASTTSPNLDDVTDARDGAADVLHRLVAYAREVQE